MSASVKIGDYLIGRGHPCFIIAEAGVNHNGDMDLAFRLIAAAAESGVDAVKFQSFIAEDLVTPKAQKAGYQVKTTGESGGQYGMLKALELRMEQHRMLKSRCERAGVMYLCTPYENKSLNMLDRLGVAAFKIASTDTTNIPFLQCIAKKGRPVILSTGMCNMGEVEAAVMVLKEGSLDGKIVLLQCTSEYPAPMNEVNLKAMSTMQRAFACPVGFSDHTSGIIASSWAVVMGACMIEKHFTLNRGLEGPDHRASIEPDELKELVRTIRDAEAAVGDGIKRPSFRETPNKPRMQKSVVAAHDIRAGDVIREEDLTCKRPGTGLPPIWIDRIVGNVAKRNMKKDKMISIDLVEWSK